MTTIHHAYDICNNPQAKASSALNSVAAVHARLEAEEEKTIRFGYIDYELEDAGVCYTDRTAAGGMYSTADWVISVLKDTAATSKESYTHI